MSEKTYPLDVGKSAYCQEIYVTAEQAAPIEARCAEIRKEAEAAKEAAKPKEYDAGVSDERDTVIYGYNGWIYLSGNYVLPKHHPKTALFNIKDVLEQGEIVIGMSREEAGFFRGYSTFKERIMAALERNK